MEDEHLMDDILNDTPVKESTGRSLAHIERILEINEHDNADSLELITVLGWQVVAKKGEFQVGDLVVYCEIDSILPPKPEFEFLANKKYRIKTIRLRGEISQGICFPLTILPTGSFVDEGADVTKDLQIEKFEPSIPACLSGKIKGHRPDWIPKTDEERVQNIPEILEEYKGKRFYVSEKCDGSSCSIGIKDGEFVVCSRKLNLIESESNTFWQVVRQFDIEKKLRSLGKNIVIQGELIGNGIQKNKYKLKEHDIYFFNARNVDKYEYYDYKEFVEIIESLGLKTVPIIDDNFILNHSVDQLLKYADGESKIYDLGLREGVVLRPLIEQHHKGLGRLSFKAISNEFLLKHGE
jgi:RNA ligase (TIGR02306 family)